MRPEGDEPRELGLSLRAAGRPRAGVTARPPEIRGS
jgi:hypothetical protein